MINKTKLNPLALQILRCYQEMWRPPSTRQIAKVLGCHHSHVQAVKRELVLKGFLTEDGFPNPEST